MLPPFGFIYEIKRGEIGGRQEKQEMKHRRWSGQKHVTAGRLRVKQWMRLERKMITERSINGSLRPAKGPSLQKMAVSMVSELL